MDTNNNNVSQYDNKCPSQAGIVTGKPHCAMSELQSTYRHVGPSADE